MYTSEKIKKGLRSPHLIQNEINRKAKRVWNDSILSQVPHDISIRGNYRTGNVGNRAVGQILRYQLAQRDHHVRLFSDHVTNTRAPVRIIGGGGGFHDQFGTAKLESRLDFVSGDGGAILATGVPGICTDEGREIVESKLSNIDLITVRSKNDYKKLKEISDIPIHIAACPTLLYTDPDTTTLQRTGVNFLPWFSDPDYYLDYSDHNILSSYFGYEPEIDVREAKSKYIKNMQYICDNVKNPVFIPFQKADEIFARKHLDIEIWPFEFSVNKTFERVSSVDRMVTTRYHSLIFAVVCEKPVLPIAYAPKVTALTEQLGLPSYLPHKSVSLEFESASNLTTVRKSAFKNINLLNKIVLNESTEDVRMDKILVAPNQLDD